MKRIHVIGIAVALALAACGDSATGETTTTTPPPATTASTAATTTTVPPTTTVPSTTTTTLAETTTTADREAFGGSDLRRIQAAMAQTAEAESARVAGEIRIVGAPDFEGEVAFSFSGAYDSLTGDSSFSIDMSSLAGMIDMESETTEDDAFGAMFAELFLGMFTEFEVRQVGDTVYMNNPFFVSLSGAETEWVAMPADESTSVTGGFVDTSPGAPGDLLGAYEDAEGAVEKLGTEIVNGVETTHYRITYDTAALLEGASDEERAALEDNQAIYGETLDLDVWMTDEHIHRFVMDIDGTELDLPPDEQFERIVYTYEVFDYGQAVTIEVPPADQVTFVDGDSLGMGFDLSG